jgi:uncharacterized protein (DUF2252 family)
MAMRVQADLSTVDEVEASARARRKDVPRSSHGDWVPPADRFDAVELIEGQNADRLPWLVPVRRGRMAESPFAFFRGAARIMATDLSATPITGFDVQLCGDAHLANFGAYASPERSLVFDVNDFDETLPGPFEWDVKRLVASFAIAGQHRQFDPGVCRDLAENASRAYRLAMREFAGRSWLENWYSRIPVEELAQLVRDRAAAGEMRKKEAKRVAKRLDQFAARAKSKNHLQAAAKLVEESDGSYRFKSVPPLLVPLRDLPRSREDPDGVQAQVLTAYDQYASSLSDRTRELLGRYRLLDVAIKVVGVGSVGTRCLVALFMGRIPGDVLLLQVKEATQSVLAEHLPPSRFQLHGRRVVEGQRLMQASSDIFLGWTSNVGEGHHYYWRQLKDWKGSVDLDRAPQRGFVRYGELCGLTLARAHAVSGDPAAISGYLGSGRAFDETMGEFAMRYAEQNRADYDAFRTAIEDGRLEADTVG